MRVIVLGANESSLTNGTVEQAWQLVDALGRDEAFTLIVDRIGETPRGRNDILDGWVALAEGIDALAHATRH